MMNMNGASVIERRDTTIFIRLPMELWRSCGLCNCPTCKGKEGFWDTLAVSTKPVKNGRPDYTWTVHHPIGGTTEYESKAIRTVKSIEFAGNFHYDEEKFDLLLLIMADKRISMETRLLALYRYYNDGMGFTDDPINEEEMNKLLAEAENSDVYFPRGRRSRRKNIHYKGMILK